MFLEVQTLICNEMMNLKANPFPSKEHANPNVLYVLVTDLWGFTQVSHPYVLQLYMVASRAAEVLAAVTKKIVPIENGSQRQVS